MADADGDAEDSTDTAPESEWIGRRAFIGLTGLLGLGAMGGIQAHHKGGHGGLNGDDTRTNVSDDGSQVVADATDINFATALAVSDDGDGSVTVESTAETGVPTLASGTVTLASGADPAYSAPLDVDLAEDATYTPVVTPATDTTPSTTYAYNATWGRVWDEEAGAAYPYLVVNWDHDPGTDIDLVWALKGI